ncbi:hypothetical protein SDJN02_19847, partial [Cucurbita argyrosperma subsp. argyrosperma]
MQRHGGPRKGRASVVVQSDPILNASEVLCVLLVIKFADLAIILPSLHRRLGLLSLAASGGIDPPVVCPLFHAASLFRPELDGGVDPSEGEGSGSKKREENVRSRRMIRALKAMVSKKVENPTRVQVLTAFIYKAIVSAKNALSDQSNTNTSQHEK